MRKSEREKERESEKERNIEALRSTNHPAVSNVSITNTLHAKPI